jgi:hypothetical protein
VVTIRRPGALHLSPSEAAGFFQSHSTRPFRSSSAAIGRFERVKVAPAPDFDWDVFQCDTQFRVEASGWVPAGTKSAFLVQEGLVEDTSLGSAHVPAVAIWWQTKPEWAPVLRSVKVGRKGRVTIGRNGARHIGLRGAGDGQEPLAQPVVIAGPFSDGAVRVFSKESMTKVVWLLLPGTDGGELCG